MNEWTKSLLHRWMFIKQDRGSTDPMYSRCVRCGVWKIATHYRLGQNAMGLKRYSANYSPASIGPWVTSSQLLPCEGFDSPSLFPKWFNGVFEGRAAAGLDAGNSLIKKGKL